jgi:hypothetical protein
LARKVVISFSLFSLYGKKLPLVFLPKGHISPQKWLFIGKREWRIARHHPRALSLSLSSLLCVSLVRARAGDLAHQFANITPTHCAKSRDCSTQLLNLHMYSYNRRESGIHSRNFFLSFFHGPIAPNAAPMLCLFVVVVAHFFVMPVCLIARLSESVNSR